MYFFKKSCNTKLLSLLIIILFILYLFFRRRSYTDFDERNWYEENQDNISEKMAPDTGNIDIEGIMKFKKLISETNRDQIVYNIDSFGPEFTLAIVIQVHDRAFYLEQLLASLKNAKGISKCLIIFSHDCIDEDIDSKIRKVTFTKYTRIIYPYNVQTHPLVFPGRDLKYCPRTIINCETNVRYRNPELTQSKHHWWWTVSTVFERLTITNNYTGNILFLEEDQYATQDFIYVLKLIERILPKHYPNYDIIALGTKYPKSKNYRINETTGVIEPWGLSENIAIAFNSTFWKVLRNFSEDFCRFNDWHWSNSLKYISLKSTKARFIVLSIKSARVVRYETCQSSNDSYCHEVEKVIYVSKFIRSVQNTFYPQSLSYRLKNLRPRVKAMGGWKDVRDHELCMFYTSDLRTEV